jgi:hypothetical protein
MVDQQDLGAAEFRNTDDHLPEMIGLALTQTTTRLVHHHETRLRDNAACHFHEAPLARIQRSADAFRLPVSPCPFRKFHPC